MSSLNLTSLLSNITAFPTNEAAPVSGDAYSIQSIAFDHIFALETVSVNDGVIIQAFPTDDPTENMLFEFLTYPTTDGSLVASLQVVSTITILPPQFLQRGGYVRPDATNINKLSQGAEPFAWSLFEVAKGAFMISPFDTIYNLNGDVFITDPQEEYVDPEVNQLTLEAGTSDPESVLQQIWTFNPIASDSD